MFFKSCFVNVFTVTIFAFIIRSEKKLIAISLFKKLIYEIQIICNVDVDYVENRFRENENKAVESHIPRHHDSKTKKLRHQDSKAKKLWHWDLGTKTPQHQEMETTNPRHHDSKAFFHRTKKPRHQDSKTKKSQHWVSVEFWLLCPMINTGGTAEHWRNTGTLTKHRNTGRTTEN